MPSFLVFSDTHSQIPQTYEVPDSLGTTMSIGDFTNFGNLGERFFEAFKDRSPVYYVSGNHELPDLCRDMDEYYHSVCLDYQWRVVEDVLLVGLAGHDIFHACREENLTHFFHRLKEANVVDGSRFSILLTHEPPWPWRYEGKTRGSEIVREFAKGFPFDLILTGHFHEEKTRLERESVFCPTINPSAQGCQLEIDTKSRKWQMTPLR